MGSYIDASMRIQTEYMSFKNGWTISSSNDFQAHLQRSQMLPGLSSALPGLSPALLGAPRLNVGVPRLVTRAPRCSQTYQNHSHRTHVPVIRDHSDFLGQPECPPMVWHSPEIDTSKFTFHILSDTPGGYQWLKYILLMSVKFRFCRLIHHFQVVLWVRHIQSWVMACQNPVRGSGKLPYNNFFDKGLACGFWLPPANNILPKGDTGLHSDTMRYDRKYVLCDIGEISVLWVCFLLLAPPVGYVRYTKCTTNLHLVVVVIFEIWLNWPTVVWYFRRQIQIEPGCGESACCTITSLWCRLSHIVRY